MRQRAEHPADGVPKLAVGIDVGLQHILAEPLVFPIVGRHHPEPQDVRARLPDHILRHDGVAERLRHFPPFLIHGEAMGDDGVVGRAAARAAAFEQRGVEPAAMLVGAFEIDVGRPLQVGPVLQRENMRRTGIEPDIEDVGDLRPRLVGAASEEAFTRALGKPGIRALLFEGVRDALVDRLVLEHVAVGVGEDGDRHPPGALPRQHPVRALLDHRAQPRLACRRHEARRVDRGKGAGPQRVTPSGPPGHLPHRGGGERQGASRWCRARRRRCGRPSLPSMGRVRPKVGGGVNTEPIPAQFLVHMDEPLRRVAEDDRLLRAPAVRILVLQPPAREQHVALDQRVDDGLVGVALLAVVVDDARRPAFAIRPKARRVLGEVAGVVDGEGDRFELSMPVA